MSLNTQHQQEWQNSGVAESIITQNVITLTDSKEIAAKLGWKAWKNGQGWLVSGIDPKTGDRTLEGAQFKPDTPTTSNSGKPQKYLSRKGATSPLFLATEDNDFWSATLSNRLTPILITEGAKKAGIALSLGVPCISLPGVANGQKGDRLHIALKQFCQEGRKFYLAFDADLWDNPNVARELDRLSRLLSAEGGVVYVITWNKENGKGLDDWLVGIPEAQRSKKLQNAIALAKTMAEFRKINGVDKERKVRLSIYQEIMRDLYSDPWVVVKGSFYRWNGTYYELSPEENERKRIWNYCNRYEVEDKDGYITYPHATPKRLDEAIKWVRSALGRSPDSVNPSGYLNCTNGVLQIRWEHKGGALLPTWQLLPHNPEIVYLYPPSVKYDPDADPTHCDRLLQCLDADQRTIFLRTIAASLDLETVRSVKGRAVRALLMKGNGNNGKDTLREVLSMVYGHQGLTACTFTDFKSYDGGRKFPLSKLQHSRVNWSPENSLYDNLDSLQSLKAAISGDVLDYEGKGKDEYSGSVKAVFLFNCNDTPNFVGAMEAIQSRYAILRFNKTFKPNADPRKGELEADPRFKYDPKFLEDCVLPAFLNQMLSSLVDLMVEGIDYYSTAIAMEEIQRERNHLYQFAADTGLDYDPDSFVYVGEIWKRLHEWYLDNGTITVDGGKETWTEQVRSRDKNVKGANQVLPRILELFPKAKKGKKDLRGMKIQGLRFIDPSELTPEQTQQCDSLEQNDAKTQKTEEVEKKQPSTQTASSASYIASATIAVSEFEVYDATKNGQSDCVITASKNDAVDSGNGHQSSENNVTVDLATATEDELIRVFPGLKNFDWKG